MTSAQTMQEGAGRFIGQRADVLVLALAAFVCGGCTPKATLTPPISLASPYEARQVWAVVPFNNESGVSNIAGDRIADGFTSEAEQINGIDTLPVNRVIAAMRRLNLSAVTTPAQARSLMTLLGVDGLIVGTVTAYDPYQPPRFGAAVALFAAEAVDMPSIDPVQVTRARTDAIAPGALPSDAPIAQASGIFDAGNHQTLQQLEAYAAGRNEPSSAYGIRIYAVRMDLYTQFAAYRLLHDLLDSERARVTPVQTAGVEHASSDRDVESLPSR